MGRLETAIRSLKYDAQGLVPVVCVDSGTRQVLMLAYADEQALLETARTGKAHFYSRSRRRQWMKGETSGHVQEVRAILTDCDMDAVVLEVVQHGAACHEGYYSCFFRRLNTAGQWEAIAKKVFEPSRVYKDRT